MKISTKLAKSVAYRFHYLKKARYDRECEGFHRMPAYSAIPKRERKLDVAALKQAMQESLNRHEPHFSTKPYDDLHKDIVKFIAWLNEGGGYGGLMERGHSREIAEELEALLQKHHNPSTFEGQ